jgi:hypothetical protein
MGQFTDRVKVRGKRYDIALKVGTEHTPCGVIEAFRYPDGTQVWGAISFTATGHSIAEDERDDFPDRESAIRWVLYESLGVDVPSWVREHLDAWRNATPHLQNADWTSAEHVSPEAINIALALALDVEMWLHDVPGGLQSRKPTNPQS